MKKNLLFKQNSNGFHCEICDTDIKYCYFCGKALCKCEESVFDRLVAYLIKDPFLCKACFNEFKSKGLR